MTPRSGTPGSSRRGGKYVVTSVMGLDPERLNVFVASLKRHSPHTRLVVFVEEQTDSKLLKAAGAEVIPFEMPSDSALVLHRWAGRGGGPAGGACTLLSALPTTCHPAVPLSRGLASASRASASRAEPARTRPGSAQCPALCLPALCLPRSTCRATLPACAAPGMRGSCSMYAVGAPDVVGCGAAGAWSGC